MLQRHATNTSISKFVGQTATSTLAKLDNLRRSFIKVEDPFQDLNGEVFEIHGLRQMVEAVKKEKSKTLRSENAQTREKWTTLKMALKFQTLGASLTETSPQNILLGLNVPVARGLHAFTGDPSHNKVKTRMMIVGRKNCVSG